MKKIIFLLLVLAGMHCSAQLSISIKPSHNSFMQYDAVRMKVYLHNYSSMPIAFGQNQALRGELEFIIYHNNRTLLKKRESSASILSGIILKPGEMRTVTLDISKYYPMQEEGEYNVTATVSHPKLPSKYRSKTVMFNIGSGSKYWERTFGIPDYTGRRMGVPLPPRKYHVRTFFNGIAHIYFLLVEDAKNVYAVRRLGFNLGPEYPPQFIVDGAARLHAMLNVSQKVFIYYIIDYNGKLEKREVYIKTTSKPFLVANPTNSSVIVDGGRIALKDVDYEEIKDLPFMDSIDRNDDEKESPIGSFGDFEEEK